MARKRRRFTAEFKARVALEALRERDGVQAIAARHELHSNQVSAWVRQLLDAVPAVTSSCSSDVGRRSCGVSMAAQEQDPRTAHNPEPRPQRAINVDGLGLNRM